MQKVQEKRIGRISLIRRTKMVETRNSFTGKHVTECSYCGKKMPFYQVIGHEEPCRKIKKLCDGYGDCRNIGVLIMKTDKETSRWCFTCLKRYKEENPKLNIEMPTIRKEVRVT